MPSHERQLKAIVFSDVVDSSLKIFADELIAIQRIKEDLTLIREELRRHGGYLVKSLGDGLLATFDGPTQALEFVQSAVQKLSERGRHPLAHRFGLHTGEIYADGDDILGQGVHLASRLQTVSPSNGVAFVRSTYDLIDPRLRRLAQSMGEVELKGLPEPVQVFALGPEQLLDFGQSGSPEALQLETLLAGTPFELVRPLGRSANPQTLLLQERQRERQAVLKLIPASPALAEALQVEAACLDRLRHPRIPRVLDGYARAGRFCFIQEYIPGPSLQGSLDLLRRKQRLAELLRQVLQVLEQVHAAGMVHGDIHPANLIPPAEGGPVFLVDFSLLKARVDACRQQPDGGSASLLEARRPFFSAPERARFGRLTAAADLYALGVAALALYTGQEPATLYDEAQGCWSLQGLEPEVAGWLAPLLEDLPARRVQHAADALRLLDPPLVRPAVPAAAPAAAEISATAVRKPLLHNRLVTTYGPMVELLLDSQPSLISSDQLPALQDRLVAAGLALSDVQEAFRAAAQEPPAPPQASSIPEPEGPAPAAPSSSVVPARAPEGDLLPLLRQAIGPIADQLWSEAIADAVHIAPVRLQELLLEAGVPADAVQLVLTQWSAADSVPEAPSTPEAAASTPSPVALPPSAVDGEQLVLQLVGPIGSTVWAQVAHLPPPARLDELEQVLRGYGLEEASLVELRRQLEGG